MGGIFRQYSWIANLVGILFCSFFLAKITGVYLGKALEVKRSIGVLKAPETATAEKKEVSVTEYNVIIERNMFDSVERGGAAGGEAGSGAAEEEVVPTGEAVKTNLSITVLGVLVVGDGRDKRSSATVTSGSGGGGGKGKGGSGGASVYAVGDVESFAPSTKLTRVQPDRIEFINSGRLEYAEVATEFGDSIFGPPKTEETAEKEPTAKKEPLAQKEVSGKLAVDQREIDDALQNLDRLYTEIRAVPYFTGGKVSGMKILSIKSGSLFAKLGLKRGDVLQRINSLELDVKRGFEIFSQLKDQKNMTLDLIRQNQPLTLEYEIR